MLTGVPPFYDSDRNVIMKKILKQNVIHFKDYHSSAAKDLIKKLLNKDPKRRLGYKGGAK